MRGSERILGEKLFSMIARPTFYKQFVGGDTESELSDCSTTLSSIGLKLMVCPAMEEDEGEGDGEDKYLCNMNYIQEIGAIMARQQMDKPLLQFKITAMVSADLVKKLATMVTTKQRMEEVATKIAEAMEKEEDICLKDLSPEENSSLNNSIKRLSSFCKAGLSHNLSLLVDAEYTYLNPGISLFCLAAMKVFNKRRPLLWNTYQTYLKGAARDILQDISMTESWGCCFGAKVVRGAYLEKERLLARQQGYPDPVCDTYEDTGAMYRSVVDIMLVHVTNGKHYSQVVFGTHNEEGAKYVARRLVETGLPPNTENVVFGQIYGMADQISVPLAKAGFNVYKSVPYGPLGEVLPYLSRRAAENRVVLAGARREQELLRKEIKNRVFLKYMS